MLIDKRAHYYPRARASNKYCALKGCIRRARACSCKSYALMVITAFNDARRRHRDRAKIRAQRQRHIYIYTTHQRQPIGTIFAKSFFTGTHTHINPQDGDGAQHTNTIS